MDGITDSMDMSLSKLWEMMKDREAYPSCWHGMAFCIPWGHKEVHQEGCDLCEDHKGGDWGADGTRQRAGEDTDGGTSKQAGSGEPCWAPVQSTGVLEGTGGHTLHMH